jgi:hypothetical protein
MIPQAAQDFFVGRRPHPTNATELGVLFDHPEAAIAGDGIVNEDADVDPLFAKEAGDIPQNAVDERVLLRRSNAIRSVGFGIAIVLFGHRRSSFEIQDKITP